MLMCANQAEISELENLGLMQILAHPFPCNANNDSAFDLLPLMCAYSLTLHAKAEKL